MTPPSANSLGDDPRQIREHLVRSRELANTHGLPCTVVGVAGAPEDAMTPEFLNYVESALRVEDAIFRMTRERAVLFLADADGDKARAIVERLLRDFSAEVPSVSQVQPSLGFFPVEPGCAELLVKDVLPAVFPPPPTPRTH